MKVYKTNDLRSSSAEIFNEVLRNDMVVLTSRDRPNMVLSIKETIDDMRDELSFLRQAVREAAFDESLNR